MLLKGSHTHRALSSHVWLGLTLPLVEAFFLLVIAMKVFTADNLIRRGMTSSNIFRPLCYEWQGGYDLPSTSSLRCDNHSLVRFYRKMLSGMVLSEEYCRDYRLLVWWVFCWLRAHLMEDDSSF